MKTIIAFALAYLLLHILPASAQGPDLTKRAPTAPDLQSRTEEKGQLHEKLDLPEGYVLYKNLKDLSRNSSVVLLGKAISNLCELSPDRKGVMTRYKIRVDDLLADDFAAVDPKADGFREKFSEGRVGLKKGSTVDVILPGGKISFPGGATAQIDVMNVQRMESGHSYLLYLHYSAQLRGFVVTGLSRGMFEIADDGESLHWMAVTKTDKGFRLESKTFESSVSNARTEAKMNKDAHR